MYRYNPSESIFAGMTRAQKQQALTNAQQALLDLMSGEKGVTFSYTQGDGTRSVTYQQTSMSDLRMLIRQLQADLGMISRPRRPARFRW
ncbi:gpW family protein [Erwinia tracheiphila]|uniref:Phage head-tail adapter protein n=1 Tax=Erwinia tracheiphila TaxID=65700 RepID=A0A345CNT1_9GAMM|nr:gpW family protein [Erwinia tracheiphila]AXF75098.1 phage head-tail adapter protein [Erwinia tracheiphila]UIA82354.1 gpW family protein [Erwinia tracheiphila]UIA90950.1 gpW family protein [Erwinia tracheiphila]